VKKIKNPLGGRANSWYIFGHNYPTPYASRLTKVSKASEYHPPHFKPLSKSLLSLCFSF